MMTGQGCRRASALAPCSAAKGWMKIFLGQVWACRLLPIWLISMRVSLRLESSKQGGLRAELLLPLATS